MTALTELPIDILFIILQYLSKAKDLLSLCASCRSFQETGALRFDSAFWSRLTNETFRVPNRPVIAGDGKRWQNLYRRFSKESKVYCWGNNDGGSLGRPAYARRHGFPARARGPRFVQTFENDVQSTASWPQELRLPNDIGVISDLQCGGWSTAALNAEGRIHITGMLRDGLGMGGHTSHMCELLLPFGHDEDRVRQFSLGRSHLLAVGDQGRVYNWDDIERRGSPIKFTSLTEPNNVGKVVAGWGHSSCFIPGKGIVVWEPLPSRLQNSSDLPAEPTKIFDIWIVPHTESLHSRIKPDPGSKSSAYGRVTNWVMLSDCIIWVTDLGRAFGVRIPDNARDAMQESFEITPKEEAEGKEYHVIDVQGSHAHFALIMRNGEVLTSEQSILLNFWQMKHLTGVAEARNTEQTDHALIYRRIPALQHSGVIQVAFGDWHFHALHNDGTVTSFGREPKFCGALGLGGNGIDAVRGIKAQGFGGDGEMLAQCATTGRKVCFEPEKQLWLNHVRTGGQNKREAEERMNMMYENDENRAEVSEWFEHRLRQWDQLSPAYAEDDDPEDDGLPAYFVLSVAAAGWHSGALVLQNEKKRAKVRDWYTRRHANSQELPGRAGESSSPSADNEAGTGLVDQMKSSLVDAGRWFLGLPTVGHPARPVSPTYEETFWIWDDETFPRLKLKDGRTLPGTREVEGWSCPAWKEVEEVRVT